MWKWDRNEQMQKKRELSYDKKIFTVEQMFLFLKERFGPQAGGN
jgi:hypothetical protein